MAGSFPRGADGRPGVSVATGAGSSRRLTAEVWIVLGLSLGASAVYALVAIAARLTAETPLRDQAGGAQPLPLAATAARPHLPAPRGIGFALVPVVLALYLLSTSGRSAVRRIGLDLRDPWRTLGLGAALAAVIGIPGVVRVGARSRGRDHRGRAGRDPGEPLVDHPGADPRRPAERPAGGGRGRRVPARAADRSCAWAPVAQVAASALLRGSYHLYQGIGPFIGNALMGSSSPSTTGDGAA